MHFSKIEAATAPSLFDVYTDCSSMIGPKPGPRQAVDSEIYAYAAWLAFKAGMMPREAREIIGYGYRRGQRRSSPCKGVTYGKKGDWNNESRAYDYEPGSYSVPFPGRNAHRDTVTFETLDDDGNVIASSCLPVEPKKGGVVWDREAVRKAVGKVEKVAKARRTQTSEVKEVGGNLYQINRGEFGTSIFHNPRDGADGYAQPAIVIGEPMQGRTDAEIDAIIAAHLTPPSVEMTIKAENPPAETQEHIRTADCPSEPVAVASGPGIGCHGTSATECENSPDMSTDAPAEPVSNRDELAAPALADRVAALAAMVEEMRGQLAALSTGTEESTTPIEGMTTEPPVSGKRERTAAHERAIRRAWTERAVRRDAERHLVIGRGQYAGCLADLDQSRKDCAAMTTLYAEAVANLEAARAEIGALKSRPHHMGQEIKPDDYQRLIRERDEARASLASESEKLRVMRTNLERGTDALDMMTERALRAENALRALEQRRERADGPYRVNVGPVSFRAAA